LRKIRRIERAGKGVTRYRRVAENPELHAPEHMMYVEYASRRYAHGEPAIAGVDRVDTESAGFVLSRGAHGHQRIGIAARRRGRRAVPCRRGDIGDSRAYQEREEKDLYACENIFLHTFLLLLLIFN